MQRPGARAQYKSHQYEPFLSVSFCNIMQIRWKTVPGSCTKITETTPSKFGSCSWQDVEESVKPGLYPLPAAETVIHTHLVPGICVAYLVH